MFVGCDFALSATAGADFSVYVAGRFIEGRLEIVNIYRKKGLPSPEQVELIKKIYRAQRPISIYVEDNSFGMPIFQYLQQQVPIVQPFHTSQQSKQSIIRQLQELLHNKKLVVAEGITDEEKENSAQWKKEMQLFSKIMNKAGTNYQLKGMGEHDDCVMATAILCQAVTDWSTLGGGFGLALAAPPEYGPSNTERPREAFISLMSNANKQKVNKIDLTIPQLTRRRR